MSQFDGITKYIPQLESDGPFATIIREETRPGVISLPVIEYTPLAKEIINAFYAITESREDYSMDTSGHADADTIKRLIAHVNPTEIIPVHTENAAWFTPMG